MLGLSLAVTLIPPAMTPTLVCAKAEHSVDVTGPAKGSTGGVGANVGGGMFGAYVRARNLGSTSRQCTPLLTAKPACGNNVQWCVPAELCIDRGWHWWQRLQQQLQLCFYHCTLPDSDQAHGQVLIRRTAKCALGQCFPPHAHGAPLQSTPRTDTGGWTSCFEAAHKCTRSRDGSLCSLQFPREGPTPMLDAPAASYAGWRWSLHSLETHRHTLSTSTHMLRPPHTQAHTLT